MSKTTIKDTRIAIRPSTQLLRFIEQNKDSIVELPDNLAKALKSGGFDVPAKIEILKDGTAYNSPKINMNLLSQLLNNQDLKCEAIKTENTTDNKKKKDTSAPHTDVCLDLSDLRWLNNFLATLRREKKAQEFLHNLIETCSVELPKNEVIERNPVLEARCQKLREEQQNREYRKMTKNVDASLKNFPEDTVAYQMKALNSQIIAVLQFVFSVVAGFVFGFLGIELIIGNIEFGLRLLLGIMCALIIALAEIYFLAKKLNEYDEIPEVGSFGTPTKNKKPHAD